MSEIKIPDALELSEQPYVPHTDDVLNDDIIAAALGKIGYKGEADPMIRAFAWALLDAMNEAPGGQRVIRHPRGGGWRAPGVDPANSALHSFPIGALVRFTEEAQRITFNNRQADGGVHIVTGYPTPSLHDVTLDNGQSWSTTWLTWTHEHERDRWIRATS